jgi:hypothetical protein
VEGETRQTPPAAGPWKQHLPLPLDVSPPQERHPCIIQSFDSFLQHVNGKRLAVFLDYDGECKTHAPPLGRPPTGLCV